MSAEHRRPLAAFILVALACALVVGQSAAHRHVPATRRRRAAAQRPGPDRAGHAVHDRRVRRTTAAAATCRTSVAPSSPCPVRRRRAGPVTTAVATVPIVVPDRRGAAPSPGPLPAARSAAGASTRTAGRQHAPPRRAATATSGAPTVAPARGTPTLSPGRTKHVPTVVAKPGRTDHKGPSHQLNRGQHAAEKATHRQEGTTTGSTGAPEGARQRAPQGHQKGHATGSTRASRTHPKQHQPKQHHEAAPEGPAEAPPEAPLSGEHIPARCSRPARPLSAISCARLRCPNTVVFTRFVGRTPSTLSDWERIMSAEHKRPLVAFILVALVCSSIVGQSVRSALLGNGIGLGILVPIAPAHLLDTIQASGANGRYLDTPFLGTAISAVGDVPEPAAPELAPPRPAPPSRRRPCRRRRRQRGRAGVVQVVATRSRTTTVPRAHRTPTTRHTIPRPHPAPPRHR